MNSKVLAIGSSIVVLAAIIAAFVTIGGPGRQRSLKFDEQRINDLQNIQNQTINYWQQKNKLPATLADLTDSISGFKAPMDPQTSSPYEYNVLSATSFELCANFSLPSDSIDMKTRVVPNIYPYYSWDHGGGRVCFNRSIDPELYNVKPLPL